MVAANPLFVGGGYYKKFKATVVNDIWPEVLFFTLVGCSEYNDTSLAHLTEVAHRAWQW